MIFGKYINRYYWKHAPTLLLGLAALILVDYMQLIIPELYRMLINGVNSGSVLVEGVPTPFTREVLLPECLPAHDRHHCVHGVWPFFVAHLLFWRGHSGWRPICATGCLTTARICPRPITRSTKVGNLMSLYTNDLDTIQECFGDGVLMFLRRFVPGSAGLY